MSAASEAVRLRKASSMSGSVLRTATSPARQKRSAWSAPHDSKAGSAPWRARQSSWAATAMGPSASSPTSTPGDGGPFRARWYGLGGRRLSSVDQWRAFMMHDDRIARLDEFEVQTTLEMRQIAD